MNKFTIGIDPGLTGGIAVLESNGLPLLAGDLPVIRDGKSAWIDADALLSILMKFTGTKCVTIERVHAMPKNGSQAAFSQGCTFGSILATLQIARCTIEFVQPAMWKRSLGLIANKDMTDSQRKQMSLDKARLLFPDADLDRKKDHGRAEALLIAHYAMIARVEKVA